MSKTQEITGYGQDAQQSINALQFLRAREEPPFILSNCETIGDLCARGHTNRLTTSILDLAVFDFAYYTLLWFGLKPLKRRNGVLAKSPLKWRKGVLARRIRKIRKYLDRTGEPPTEAMEVIGLLYHSLFDEFFNNHGVLGYAVFAQFWSYIEETLWAWCESGFSLDFRYNEYFANLYQQDVS
ncbi:MAG: hypothetical protein D6735_01565 [Acidobacteria bacterium]|nr:MAG: hypothetical protein D6735_01565 [Acidobacteriota bacterium]